MTRRLASMTQADRVAAVRPFVGQWCRVTYRAGSYGDYERSAVGRVLGASYHATNGNSTGDLIVAAPQGHVFDRAGANWQALSIALVHVGGIELVTSLKERAR